MPRSHTGELTGDDLRAWHRLLMVHSELDSSLIGAWRDRLGWIGGPFPQRAAYGRLARADRWSDGRPAGFLRKTDLDPVTQAAIAHAQFETIHPFACLTGGVTCDPQWTGPKLSRDWWA